MLLTSMCKYLLAFSAGLACGIVSWFACSSNFWRNLQRKEKVIYHEVKTHSPNEYFHKGEDVLAKQLSNQVRVLCLVLTYPKDHHKALSIKATWGKRCNVLIFMSSKNNATIPTIVLPKTRLKGFWGRTKMSFRYVYEHHIDSVDWVLKTGSDTFMIMENLRYLLSDYNSTEALYLGRYFKRKSSGFMSGESGYVLSKEAVRRLVEKGMDSKGRNKCRQDDKGYEDLEMGRCLKTLAVKAVDSRDNLDRGRFFPFRLQDHLHHVKNWGSNFWYHRWNHFRDDEGLRCCSDLSISFRANPHDMYSMEYFIYHLRPYGIKHNVSASLNRRLNDSEIRDF